MIAFVIGPFVIHYCYSDNNNEAESEYTSTVDYKRSDKVFKIITFETPYKTTGVFGNTDQCT